MKTITTFWPFILIGFLVGISMGTGTMSVVIGFLITLGIGITIWLAVPAIYVATFFVSLVLSFLTGFTFYPTLGETKEITYKGIGISIATYLVSLVGGALVTSFFRG